jgi:AraC-like DNA-binding protein
MLKQWCIIYWINVTWEVSPMKSLDSILQALELLKENRSFKRVRFAEARAEPPPLAVVLGFSSLVVVLRGDYSIEYSKNGEIQQASLASNDVLAVPANCWYRPTWERSNTTLTFLFGKRQIGLSFVSAVLKNAGEPVYSKVVKHHTTYPMSGPLHRILQACEELGRENPDSAALRHMLKGLVFSCTDLVQKPVPDSKGKSHHLFQTICSYIQGHFHEPLTRESVAETFGVTPNHVSRIFQREGMMRFWDYVVMVRVDRAKFMLRTYDFPVKEISRRCGYDDSDYFCKLFRRKARMTPLEYRYKYSDQSARQPLVASV